MANRRSKGEGTIYQRPDGLWVAQITLPNGKRKSKYSKTQSVVKNWLLEQRKSLKDGMWVDSSSVLFGVFLDRYMTDVANHTLRPKTLEAYESLIRNHIKPELGSFKLSQIQPVHIQNFYSLKLNQGLSRRTVQFMHSIIHRVLKQALKWGLIARNVSDLVEAPTVKRKAPTTLTIEQSKKLLSGVREDRLYPLYVLAVTTGMREGELLGLYWEDIDFFTKTIHIKRAIQQLKGVGLVISEPKSDKSKRTIAVPDFVIDVLWEYREKTGNIEGLVFRTSNQTPFSPRNVVRHFKTQLEELGLPNIRFHDLRHTAATLLLSEGVHPKVVQEMLGHSQISLTLDTYSHVIPAMQKEAAEKMNAVFKN